jgi:hypothetical protein
MIFVVFPAGRWAAGGEQFLRQKVLVVSDLPRIFVRSTERPTLTVALFLFKFEAQK